MEILRQKQTVDLYEKYGVFTAEELASRYEILLESYTGQLLLEGRTLADMVERQILPAGNAAAAELAAWTDSLGAQQSAQGAQLRTMRTLLDGVYDGLAALRAALGEASRSGGVKARAVCAHDTLLPAMEQLRAVCDELECAVPADRWPIPTYAEMLFQD